MFNDISHDIEDRLYRWMREGHRHPERGPFDRGRRHRHGLHSGRKLTSADLHLVLLALLAEKPSHGYELIKALEEKSDGFYVPSPGMIYPALTYLEEIGYASVQVEGSKKLYDITSQGQAHLEENRSMASRILEDLERIGAQMANARRAFAGENVFEEDEDEDDRSEFGDVRREFREMLREHRRTRGEEAHRMASILHRAMGDIKRGHDRRGVKPSEGPIKDPAVNGVISRLVAAKFDPKHFRSAMGHARSFDAFAAKDIGFSIDPEQGNLIYLLCRAIDARRVAEFGTSHGLSTLYLSAAIRDNGGGIVIGSELVPEKVEIARRNLAEAGLASYAQIREGDARETLQDLGGEIDLFVVDGWPQKEGPSLSRQVIELVAPQVRKGGIVINDNGEPDYLEYIRDPANGFVTMSLPLKGGTEVSVKVK